MGIQKAADGTRLTKTSIKTLFGAPATPSPVYTVTEDIEETFSYPNDRTFQEQRRLLMRAGETKTEAQIDALFPTADITSITPATGLAAGGTAVVIIGVGFSGANPAAAGLTFGGTNATSFTIKSDKRIEAVTPAHAAGAVNVVLSDDSGTITETSGYTYT